MQIQVYDVFISYSSVNRLVADALKHYLEAAGLRCFKAPDNILPGQVFEDAIAEAIENCAAMLLVWSESSQNSEHVKRELTLAVNSGKIILPYRIEDIKPAGAFAYYLTNKHWLDAVDSNMETAMSTAAQRILSLLKVGSPTEDPCRKPLSTSSNLPSGVSEKIPGSFGRSLDSRADSNGGGDFASKRSERVFRSCTDDSGFNDTGVDAQLSDTSSAKIDLSCDLMAITEEDRDSSEAWTSFLPRLQLLKSEIDTLLSQLSSSSNKKTIQVGSNISKKTIAKVFDSHSVDKETPGKLLVRINTSNFSGKNGLLIFEEMISVKCFWEKPDHHEFNLRNSDTCLDIEIDPVEEGFVIRLVRGTFKAEYTFDNMADWSDANTRALKKFLPQLFAALGAKQQLLHASEEYIANMCAMYSLNGINKIGANKIIGMDSMNSALLWNVRKAICRSESSRETIFLVLDYSIWGDCKGGIAITSKGLYHKELLLEDRFIPWDEVYQLSIDKCLIVVNEKPFVNCLKGIDAKDAELDDVVSQAEGIACKIGSVLFACVEMLGGRSLEPSDCAYFLQLTADLYSSVGLLSESLLLWKRAYASYAIAYGDGDWLSGASMFNAGNQYAEIGKFNESISVIRSSIDKLLRSGDKSCYTGWAFIRLAELLRQTSDEKAAQKVLLDAKALLPSFEDDASALEELSIELDKALG